MKFKPTWLYIKRHTTTGMKYLGKTTKIDCPDTYKGSGVYWRNHINKHGIGYVVTDWKYLFSDKDELVEFATFLSKELNIVESNSWANLQEENGIDGVSIGSNSGDKHGMFGRVGEKCPSYGRTGNKHSRSKPVIINDKEYQSMSEAAKDLKTSVALVVFRCNSKSKKFNSWNFKNSILLNKFTC